ncbi:hypothetical protein FQR65_LT09506 [Abscondita terminalis]|nr:hypothetical protein FQR65_LT09506 [Abscondita terminalis]
MESVEDSSQALFNFLVNNNTPKNMSLFLDHQHSVVDGLLSVLNEFECERLNRPRIIILSNYHLKKSEMITLHTSVKNLLDRNEKIIIPKCIYNCDVAPTITMDVDEVYNWYARRLEFVKSQAKLNNTLSTAVGKTRGRKRKNPTLSNESSSNKKVCVPMNPTHNDTYTDKIKFKKSFKRIRVIYSDSEDEENHEENTVSDRYKLKHTVETEQCKTAFIGRNNKILGNNLIHDRVTKENEQITDLNQSLGALSSTSLPKEVTLQNNMETKQCNFKSATIQDLILQRKKLIPNILNRQFCQINNLNQDLQNRASTVKNIGVPKEVTLSLENNLNTQQSYFKLATVQDQLLQPIIPNLLNRQFRQTNNLKQDLQYRPSTTINTDVSMSKEVTLPLRNNVNIQQSNFKSATVQNLDLQRKQTIHNILNRQLPQINNLNQGLQNKPSRTKNTVTLPLENNVNTQQSYFKAATVQHQLQRKSIIRDLLNRQFRQINNLNQGLQSKVLPTTNEVTFSPQNNVNTQQYSYQSAEVQDDFLQRKQIIPNLVNSQFRQVNNLNQNRASTTKNIDIRAPEEVTLPRKNNVDTQQSRDQSSKLERILLNRHFGKINNLNQAIDVSLSTTHLEKKMWKLNNLASNQG